MATPGRNDACPCGSGKKYKRCHGLASQATGSGAALPPAAALALSAAQHHQAAGDLVRAEALYRQALAHDAGSSQALGGLGALLFQSGRLGEAQALFRSLTGVAPDLASAHCNLGVVLLVLGHAEEAVQALQHALRLLPGYATALANLGAALKGLDRVDAAEQALRDALAADAGIASAHSNLGALLMLRHDDAALASFDRALALDPRLADAHFNRSSLLREQGRIAEAMAALRRAIALAPERVPAWANLLLTLLYADSLAPQDVLAWHRRFDTMLGMTQGCSVSPHRPAPAAEWRLRVGLLSPDLRRHSVTYFVEPLLEHHDRAALELVCYHDSRVEDDVSARLKAHASRWVNTSALNDTQLAALIGADAIDVLLDLAGHTGLRMPTFARQSAPVQATWLGYPASTGLSAIGHRLTDAWADPPGHEALHSERLVRLPGSYFCYRPPADAPAPAAPPCLHCGHVTFGSFNNIAKVTPETLALWAGVLRTLPGSQLLLKAAGLAYRSVRERLAADFEVLGIDARRLRFLDWQARGDDHLAAYAEIDIALDTAPFNGATTTCEALWMGVPVVSLAGDRSQARMGASILAAAGHADWVATDPAGFAAIAARLGGDAAALAATRAGLREQLRASPLLDGARFTREFESALRSMWQSWCASGPDAVNAESAVGT